MAFEIVNILQHRFRALSSYNQYQPDLIALSSEHHKLETKSALDKLKDLTRVKVTLSIGGKNFTFYSLVHKIFNENVSDLNDNDDDYVFIDGSGMDDHELSQRVQRTVSLSLTQADAFFVNRSLY